MFVNFSGNGVAGEVFFTLGLHFILGFFLEKNRHFINVSSIYL